MRVLLSAGSDCAGALCFTDGTNYIALFQNNYIANMSGILQRRALERRGSGGEGRSGEAATKQQASPTVPTPGLGARVGTCRSVCVKSSCCYAGTAIQGSHRPLCFMRSYVPRSARVIVASHLAACVRTKISISQLECLPCPFVGLETNMSGDTFWLIYLPVIFL